MVLPSAFFAVSLKATDSAACFLSFESAAFGSFMTTLSVLPASTLACAGRSETCDVLVLRPFFTLIVTLPVTETVTP